MTANNKFLFGVSSAAFQIEGDDGRQGRGASVWDEFCKRSNTIYSNQNAKIAIDHYNRYKEDVKLMSEAGLNAYRFSVSWSRLLPDGTGRVNLQGVDFYNHLIDELLKFGIEPVLTLYHWDLPERLSERGGFRNYDFPNWFSDYAELVVKKFGDRVNWFIPFNEPINAIHSSYRSGNFAPGYQLNELQTLLCLRNMVLAHDFSAEIIRGNSAKVHIGTAMSTFEEYPYVLTDKCIFTAKKRFFEKDSLTESVDVYLDPIYTGNYPERVYTRYPEFYEVTKDDNLKKYCSYTDFIGANNYSGIPIDETGGIVEREAGFPENGMGNAIDHNGLYWECKFLSERYSLPVVITENGLASEDLIASDGKVHDSNRVDYLQKSIKIVEQLKKEIDLKGYFIWSFCDNFEWLCGYSKRFGVVYIDYKTLNRIPKDSYFFIKKYLSENK